MSLLTTTKLQEISGVVAGQTATLKLPIGRTYFAVLLNYSGVTLAQMNEIRLVINGKVQQRYVGAAVMDAVNQFDLLAAAGGILYWNLERMGMKTQAGQERTGLGTGLQPNLTPGPDYDPVKVSTLSIEIDIDGAAAAPVISAKALTGPASATGPIRKIRKYSKSPSGAGDYEISDIPKGELIQRIIFDETNINGVKIELDNITVFDRTLAENELLQANGVRASQANYFICDWGERGHATDALPTNVSDFRVTLDMAGAATTGYHVETLGYLEA